MRGSKPGEFRESSRQRAQTEARIAKGVAAMIGELDTQASRDEVRYQLAGENRIEIEGELDLRALYLAIDERAASYLRNRSNATTDDHTAT